METKVEALKDNQVKLTVTIDAKEIDERIKKTYKDFAHKYNFPGFRRGKAPRQMIDNALGEKAVVATVTDAVMNETYPVAVDTSELFPIAKPQFQESDELVEAGKPFSYEVTIAVKPELGLSSYEPVEIELPAEGASDEDIEQQIEALREHYFTYEDAAATAKITEGGYADVAMTATDEAGETLETLTCESRLYGLGVGLFPEAFDKELVGLKKGQTKSFDIDFAGEQSMMSSTLPAGTGKVHFDIEVKVVKKKELPEVTEEWAKETCGFEGLEDLKTRISESISQQKQDILPRMRENQSLFVLGERLEGDVPESMVDAAESDLLQSFFQQLQAQNTSFDVYLMQQNLTPEQFKEDVKAQATEITKQDMALDAWARHFDMQVTPEDITAEFAKSGAEDPRALEAQWRANGQIHTLRQGILRTNAITEIMDNAIVSELKPEVEEKKSAKKAGKKDIAAAEGADEKPAAKTAAKKTAAKPKADE